MVRIACIAGLLAGAAALVAPAHAQEASYQAADWDRARADLVARGPGRMAPAIREWERLKASQALPFEQYASFLLTYPGFPDAGSLQESAEARLGSEFVSGERIVAFFDRYPPVTNAARAHYALALMAQRPAAAAQVAREAWRGGQMSDAAEATIFSTYARDFTQDDHDARMDALLWQRDANAAARQIAWVSPGRREVFQARLAILQGGDGATGNASARSDPGYLYNRSRELRLEGRAHEAVDMQASRPALASLPFDQTAWVSELLQVARMGGARAARDIAARIDDAFVPGAEIADKAYKLRDDYTSLMWLGGTKALWELGDAAGAAPLFYRYGAAARTRQTRS
jgi:soluble lytic murein transglycosylase